METSFENLPEKEKRRLLRDEDTLRVMGGIYCRARHKGAKDDLGLCAKCRSCVEYAVERTRLCPHRHKGNCDQCEIRCYKPDMRAGIRTIMAYAGPRMTLRHPIMALRHLKKKLIDR